MKTFEERWTAWLDGELAGQELAEFEASLPDKAAAEQEKRDAKKLGALLQDQLQIRSMNNADFFNHELQQRIKEATREEDTSLESAPKPVLWPIGRIAWAGAVSLAIFLICTMVVMREKTPTDQSQYLTQILNAKVDPTVSPGATVSMFGERKEDKVTVIWVDGLQTLPAEYATTK